MDGWRMLRQTGDARPRWLDNPLRLFTGDIFADTLLQQAEESGSRFWQGHTHFCVAADYLAKGNREEAARYFDLCIKANCWAVDFHQSAIAIRDKMRRDPTWPGTLRGEP